MIRINLYLLLTLFATSQVLCMRHVRLSPPLSTRPTIRSHTAIPYTSKSRVPVRQYSSDQDEAKRQEVWSQIDADVAYKVNEWKIKAAKHQALVTQHTQYARSYAALAELEKDKLRLFQIAIAHVNGAALYPAEMPNLEKLALSMELITKTYDEFKATLPEDDKI